MTGKGEKLDGQGCRRCRQRAEKVQTMLAVRVRCWQLPTESPTDRVIWAGARVLFLPSLIKSYPLLQIKSALHYQAQAHNLPASQPRLLFLAIDEIGIDGHCDTAAPARTPVPDAHSRPSTSTTLHIHNLHQMLQSFASIVTWRLFRAQTAC